MKLTYEELELAHWQTQLALCEQTILVAQYRMRDLLLMIKEREKCPSPPA